MPDRDSPISSSSPSLTGRAILAVVLMIGFYLLALVIVAALLFIVIVISRISGYIALVALIGIVVILWSIIPRPDRFIPLGLLLNPVEQPKVFETIKEVALATKQTMPFEVYLTPEINAWVNNRGGVLGIGSRRVMGIGLPLLQTLSVSQFRAVIAHEFGHYYGGDTKLGPWVYRTHTTIGRTIMNLSLHSSIFSLIQLPFLWYGNMFLRITQTVSRRQEFAADALASQVAGAHALIDGLKKSQGNIVAFEAYWKGEFTPAINAGYHPPLVEGFASFLSAPSVMNLVDEVNEKALEKGNTDPYDSHPALQSRIMTVTNLPQFIDLNDDTPAITLLENIPELENQLFSKLAQLNRMSDFKPLAWEDIGIQVYLPIWKRFAVENVHFLTGVTPASFSEIGNYLKDYAQKIPETSLDELSTQGAGVTQALTLHENQLRVQAMGAALAVALHEQGWKFHHQFYDHFYLQQNDIEVYPFRVIEDLAEGKLQPEDWQNQCEAAGISELDLGKAVRTS